jgi:hypothetical protein
MSKSNKCPKCGFSNDVYTSECLECFNDLNLSLAKTKNSRFNSEKLEEQLDLIVQEVLNSFQILSSKSNSKIGYTTEIEIMEVISILENCHSSFKSLEHKVKCNSILDYLFNKRKHQVKKTLYFLA